MLKTGLIKLRTIGELVIAFARLPGLGPGICRSERRQREIESICSLEWGNEQAAGST